LWIDLGLAGFVITFLTGLLLLDPAGKRLAAVVEADGGWGPAALAQAGRLLAVARADAIVIVVVVCVMVTKPSGDDGLLLGVLAAIVAAGGAYAFARTRALGGPAMPATD
jgi:predicted anti-sigma-YlaC factor YlaD